VSRQRAAEIMSEHLIILPRGLSVRPETGGASKSWLGVASVARTAAIGTGRVLGAREVMVLDLRQGR
jgi:hypothetical protein